MDRRVSAGRGRETGAEVTRVLAICLLIATLVATVFVNRASAEPRATGDLGVVIERATGSLLIVDQSERAAIGRVDEPRGFVPCLRRLSRRTNASPMSSAATAG